MDKLIVHLYLILGIVLFAVAVIINEDPSLGIIGIKTSILWGISLVCFITGVVRYYQLEKEKP